MLPVSFGLLFGGPEKHYDPCSCPVRGCITGNHAFAAPF
jgi:hypothetical protein